MNTACLTCCDQWVTLDHPHAPNFKMKQFEFTNLNTQRDEVICYAYSLDVANGSKKELEKFYNVLLQYFPHSETDDGVRKPHDHLWDNTQQWHAARSHVASIIDDHKTKSRHRAMWWVGALTLLVLVATLFDTVRSRQQVVVCPAPKPALTNPAPAK